MELPPTKELDRLCKDSLELMQTIVKNTNGRIPHNDIIILYVLRQLMKQDCRTYFEIGVHNGGSMSIAMQSKYPCIFYGLDLFEGVNKDPKYKGSLIAKDNISKERTYQNIHTNNIYNHSFYLYQGDSRDLKFRDYIKEEVWPVDLLFIDGNHDYDAVKQDFENYSPLVRTGGLIVFDDYNNPNQKGVSKFIDSSIKKAPGSRAVSNSFIYQKT